MKNKEIEELLNELKEYASGGMSGLYPSEDTVKNFVSYIEQLEKRNKKLQEEKGHYKHLYSEVKKQKDDGIKYIKNNNLIYNHDCGEMFRFLLRMLGEKDG